MKSDAIAFGVAGIVFGLVAGWVIGTQQAKMGPQVVTTPPAQAAAAPAPVADPPAVLDEQQVSAFKTVAEREPKNATARAKLGDLYFDARQYDEATKWYVESLKIEPKNPNVSTDLAVCFFMTNDVDKALTQLDHSLTIDPKHLKTLLYVGVVRAYGKQDLAGAEKAWQQVVDIAPGSEEGRKAKAAIDGIRSGHPGETPPKPGN